MTGSYFGAGTGSGSFIGPPNGSSLLFDELLLDVQNVANALTAPSDTPSDDTTRLLEDGTNLVEWTYSTALAAWKGVQKS